MFRFQDAETGLHNINKIFERFMPVLTPMGVIIGLLLPSAFISLKPLVTWLFAFLTLVNGMGVSVREFGSVIRHPKPIFVFASLSYVILPCTTATISKILFANSPNIAIGFILLYSIPTAVAACVWSGIYEGNGALSLTMLVLGTIFAPFSTPFTVQVLGGSGITIDTKGMMLSLLLMVVIPSAAGILINFVTGGKCTEHVSPSLKPFTKIALLMVIIINTSQIADQLKENISTDYILPFVMALILTIMGFMLSFGLSRLLHLSEKDNISVVFASGMRNSSAAMVIAIDFFPAQAVMPVISGIVFQQSAAAISSHFLFGRKPKNDIK